MSLLYPAWLPPNMKIFPCPFFLARSKLAGVMIIGRTMMWEQHARELNLYIKVQIISLHRLLILIVFIFLGETWQNWLVL